MKNGSSNGGVARRRGGGGPHGGGKNGNHSNHPPNGTSNGNMNGTRRNSNPNTQRPNRPPSSNSKPSNGSSSQRPANARNMTGANAAAANKVKTAITTVTTSSPSNASNQPAAVNGETKPVSYAAAASRSSSEGETISQQTPDAQTLAFNEPTTTQPNYPSQQPNNNNKKLGDSAILASNYVPDYLKQVLYAPVDHGYQAHKLPDMMDHCHRTYFELVPCHPSQLPPLPPTIFPLPTLHIPLDPYFAIRPETKERRKRTQPQQIAPETASQPPHFVPRIILRLENAKTRDDYLNTFRLLLQEEFEEKMILYERYTQYQATIQSNNTSRAVLYIPGISHARPALEPGDEVLMRPQPIQGMNNAPKVQVHAQVVRVVRGTWKKGKMTDDKVVITWEPQVEHILQKRLLCVRFLPSSIPLQRTLEALKWMEQLHPVVAQQLLFPTETPQLPIGNDDDDRKDLMLAHAPTEEAAKLNDKQSRFVHMVLKRSRHPSRGMVRPPMILTGPAGTGKTKALLTSILRTLQQEENPLAETPRRLPKKHILVCAPSHTACDVITRRLSKSLSPSQLFRLYPSSRSIEMVPAELLPYVRMKPNEETEFILPPTQELLSFQVIVCTCSDAHILVMAGLTNSRLRIRRQQFQQYAMAIIRAGNLQAEIFGSNEPHFTHLFIDEAAQATEPESLIPLSVVVDDAPDSVKVEIALAGDPRQLSPDVYSPLEDLPKSLLERLLRLPEIGGRAHMMGPPTGESWTSMSELIEYSFQKKEDHDHLSVFLTTSYRGHPSFLMMPSKLFYFDKLRSANPFSDSVDNQWCKALRKLEAACSNVNPRAVEQESWPIHFRGVLGTDQSTAVESFLGSNSWSNPVEANEIVGIVQTLVSEGISTASIGIMGAFRGQVILIRRLLREKGLGAVNVGIVEDYQAVERDVIIVSLTRSNSAFLPADLEQRVGLFQQAKRMNVALTRAENLLVVVGDPVMMEQDSVWKQWLEFCYHHGFWYGTKSEKSSIS